MAAAQFSFEAIGTAWSIELFDALEHAEQLEKVILERIEQFDKNYSRFRDDSLVTQISREVGRCTLPEDAEPMMDLYEMLHTVTEGAITPLIGQTLVDAGYDAEYSLQPGKLSTPPKWEDVLEYDFPYLNLKRPTLLDFGAAGKGYLVDILGELLDSRGVHSYAINAGGDILYRTINDESLQVSLEHPSELDSAIGVARLRNQSLCGSSGNRRAWHGESGERYHHIINPSTLESPRHIAALWVVADSALLADGLATALFFAEPDKLAQQFDFEYAIISEDMSLTHSPDFPDEFFTEDKSNGS